MRCLVIGYGNTMRSDDGLGAYLADRVERLHIPHVDTKVAQQLHVEMAEDLAAYDMALLVDASREGPTFQLKKVDAGGAAEAPLSHDITPELLLSATHKMFGHCPDLYLCMVRGENFDFGDSLSEKAFRRAQRASRRILAFLKGGSHA